MAIRLARSGIANENLPEAHKPERMWGTKVQFRPGNDARKAGTSW